MTAATLEQPKTQAAPGGQGLSVRSMPSGRITMYAIVFDLDTDSLQRNYGAPSYNNAYADIRKLLTQKHNFIWQQGSVYFGDPERVNAVTCVMAAMDVARTFTWFAPSVRDIRMLRIEENNDLMPAVQDAAAE